MISEVIVMDKKNIIILKPATATPKTPDPALVKKPTNKGTQSKKKKKGTLSRAEYDDLRQIEYVGYDPYSD